MAFSIKRPLSRRLAIVACFVAILSACEDARSQQTSSWTPRKTESASPFIVGTNIRILTGRKYDPDLDKLIASVAGEAYSSVRFEWGLSAVETVPGSASVSGLFESSSPVQPLITLTGGGSRRFIGGMPLTEPDVTAFRNFATRSAKAFGPTPIFEIWNEWNLPTRMRPAGEVPSYIRVAKATYRALKATNKDAVVLVGAVGNDIGTGPFRPDRLKWLDAALSQGLLQTADGLSIHLYNNCGQYRAASLADMLWRIDYIHEMVLRKTGRSYPIYITEVGWPTSKSLVSKCGYPPQQSATQAARFLLAASAMPYVRGVWLYEYADRPRASGLEGQFGRKSANGEPKAQNCDLSGVVRIIRSSTRRSLEVVDGIYHFHGTDGRNGWDVYWSETGPKSQPLSGGAQDISEVCSTSRRLQDRPDVTDNPLLLKL